jgi:hypothetical protein
MSPHNPLPTLLSLLYFFVMINAQNAALGGGAAGSVGATQYPTIFGANKLVTVGGVVSTQSVQFTQTFETGLGTWAFPTPLVGSIGLGDIQGTVGLQKSQST